MSDYALLFASAFLAATILPFYSEIVVLAQLAADPQAALMIWSVASIGNTLGAALNWFLGRYLLRYEDKRWFPFKRVQLNRAQEWFQKYGYWSLLLAWAPIGGDALTFVAGIMKVPFWIFLVLTFIGKAGRYCVLIYFGGLALT